MFISFLKNHPRIRVLIIFFAVITLSIIALLSCSKKTKTYLDSNIPNKKIEPTQKTAITNPEYDKLLSAQKKQAIENKINSHESYIDDVFGNASTDKNQAKSMAQAVDPVTFYKKYNDPVETKSNHTKSTNSKGPYDSTMILQGADQKVIQKNVEVLIKNWNKAPSMQANYSMTEASSSQSSSSYRNTSLLFKAGDILVATIDTAVNSDQPNTPVMATIATGRFKNAKLLGSFTRVDDRVIIQFNTLSAKDLLQSVSINAYAIDQNTAQTALATDVDHHYLLRYGSLFAASFLQGFGTYFDRKQQIIIFERSDRDVDLQNSASLSTRNAAYAGLGQIGTALSNAMAKQFNRPPTVTLDQGTAVGILIMSDVTRK